jgi:Putative zinc-finger
MSCLFVHDDGAYVLGALSPAERLAFEEHLDGCAECTRAVRELAGLPGLLGRVDAGVLDGPPEDEPPSPSLLPALLVEVRRTRRRRLLTTAGLAAAAALLVAVPVTVWRSSEDAPPPPAAAQPMETVGGAPVRAMLSLEQVTWGTRLGLTCTYDEEYREPGEPSEVDYALFVRARDGQVEQVGSWRAVAGKEMQLSAATSLTAEEVESVEVRTAEGRVVLRLAT